MTYYSDIPLYLFVNILYITQLCYTELDGSCIHIWLIEGRNKWLVLGNNLPYRIGDYMH